MGEGSRRSAFEALGDIRYHRYGGATHLVGEAVVASKTDSLAGLIHLSTQVPGLLPDPEIFEAFH
jgi:hypothetical protein